MPWWGWLIAAVFSAQVLWYATGWAATEILRARVQGANGAAATVGL